MPIPAPYLVPLFLRLGAWRHPGMLWRLPDPGAAALTFDDGPSRFTPALLDALHNEGVRATFFLLGDRCRRHPDIVRRIASDGHALALHGDNHIAFPRLTPSALRQSWRDNAAAIRNAAPATPLLPWVRPPFGPAGPREIRLAADEGFRIAQLSILPGLHYLVPPGWAEPPALCAHRVARGLRPGAIITLHDGEDIGARDGVFDQPLAASAARAVIHSIRQAGLRLATLPP